MSVESDEEEEEEEEVEADKETEEIGMEYLIHPEKDEQPIKVHVGILIMWLHAGLVAGICV